MDGSLAFNSNAEAWRRDAPPPVGAYRCQARFPYHFEGEVRLRACGRCRGCVARDKRDRANRAAAEAACSVEVIGLTLTLRRGEPGLDRFLVEDVQRMMKRLRRQLWRDTLKRLGIKERGRKTDAQKALIEAETPKLFYLRVGERGTRRGRRHWHLCLFADKATGIKSSPTAPAKPGRRRGELQAEERPELWPHGLVTVDVMPGGRAGDTQQLYSPVELIRMGREGVAPPSTDPESAVRLVRYLHAYLEKSRGVSRRDRKVLQKQPDVVFGASNRRPLGVGWICEEARRAARAGLPWNGKYTTPGVRFSRASGAVRLDQHGRKLQRGGFIRTGSGELDEQLRKEWGALETPAQTQSAIFGKCRDHSIAAYLDEWRRLRPAVLPPMSDFCRWYDPERAEGDYRNSERLPFAYPERKPPASAFPPRVDPARRRLLEVELAGQGLIGWIKVYDTGAARWLPAGKRGEAEFLPKGDFSQQLPMLDQLAREYIERRVAEIRGPGWLTPVEWRAAAEALVRQRDAAIAAFAKPGEVVIRSDLPPEIEETALRRQFRLKGKSHHERAVALLEGRDGDQEQHGRVDDDFFPVERLVLASPCARAARPARASRPERKAARAAVVPMAAAVRPGESSASAESMKYYRQLSARMVAEGFAPLEMA